MTSFLRTVLVLLLATSDATFSDTTTFKDTAEEQRYLDAASKLRCPTCTGLSVLESDAAFSVQIKELVKEQVENGKSGDEIVDFFVKRYGPWILREPPKQGFSAIAWIFPLVLLCAGPLVIWLLVWQRRSNVQTFGARSTEEIISEMQGALKSLKESKI